MIAPAPQSSSWIDTESYFPTSRWRHNIAYDSSQELLYIYGGTGATGFELADLVKWDGTDWNWKIAKKNPGALCPSSMVYDKQREVVVLFSGIHGGETWFFDGNDWEICKVKNPPMRFNQSMVYDRSRKVTIMYGGEKWQGGNDFLFFNDTWIYNGKRWKQVGKQKNGPFVSQAAMSYDAERKVTLLFGGKTNNGYSRETWSWNGKKWKMVNTKGPSPRSYHAMAFDEDKKVTVLFGGMRILNTGRYKLFDDTWIWNGKDWKRLKITGPCARYGHAMAYFEKYKKVALVGGKQGSWEAKNDTWLFSY